MLTRIVHWQNMTGVRVAAVIIAITSVPALVWLLRASRLWGLPDVGEPFDVTAFRQIDIDPSINAWTDYLVAESLLSREGPSGTLDDTGIFMPDLSWDAVSDEDREWLEQNRSALERWRTGTEKPAALRIRPQAISLNNSIGSVQAGIRWATLSKLETLRLQSAGELDAAWTWHRAFFRYTRHRGTLDSEIERLVGISLHWAAVQRIVDWSDTPAVTAEQIETALEQIQEDFLLTETLSNTIRVEYLLAIQESELTLEDYEKWEELPVPIGDALPRPPTALSRFLLNEPEVTRRLLNHQVASLLAIVEKPREQWPPTVTSDMSYFVNSPVVDDPLLGSVEFADHVSESPLAQLCLLDVPSHRSTVREQATQSLLEVALAAQWHRRLHDAFPESIDQLVDAAMLPVAPVDPWDRNGGSLKYRRDETDSNQAIVWSVGENQVDDGGNIALGQGHVPLDQGYSLVRPANAE